ncbi:LysR family transcriptional regulator [Shewanella olleyana]|uniref:LysR family transcriptional regulator n=1 Tax=Shewanella olleyana TaxID=135626 RepID=UPI00200BADD9|nr:LysR family transcriptional regulator [Shewanella olleyana]MCL1066705.1 LysR family transcriptional regulator [Shewanella olleyana]
MNNSNNNTFRTTLMNFSLEQLIAFVAVYEERSFSKAATKLNKHRTTTGQVITNLEDTLAVELMVREGRYVEPTEEAHLLYHYAKSIIEQSKIFDKMALSLAYGGLESISFGYSSMIPLGLLQIIRRQLTNDFPSMKVNFLIKNKAELEKEIKEGSIHFGIANVHHGKGMFDMDSSLIGYIEFMPFVKKEGLLANVTPEMALTELRKSRQYVLSAFSQENLKDKVVLSAIHEEVDQVALIIKMLQDDNCWAWLPKVLSESSYATEHLQMMDLEQLKQGLKFPFALWNPHSKPLMPIKKSILMAVDEYTKHFTDLLKH